MAAAKYFSDEELECRHCHVNGTTQELRDAMDLFREAVGGPVMVHDAYRCPAHNAAVGGVPNSQHVLGKAADVSVPGMTAVALYEIALKIPEVKGIGRDDHKNYLHIDVREEFAKWCYAPSGGEEPWYNPLPAEPDKTVA